MFLIQQTEELAEKIDKIFESKKTHCWIIALVLINALVFGLDAIPSVKYEYESFLSFIDTLILSIFIVELVTRIIVTRKRFFRNNWNTFDLIITLISVLPASYGLSPIRVLRALHCLRILELTSKTRHILDGLAHSFWGIVHVVFLAIVFFYVFGIMVTDLFAMWDPEHFGSLGTSLLTLFSLMTSGDVKELKSIYTDHPISWILIISFVVIVTFFILNLVIGVIVGAMSKAEDENMAPQDSTSYEQALINMTKELTSLRKEVLNLKKDLKQQGK